MFPLQDVINILVVLFLLLVLKDLGRTFDSLTVLYCSSRPLSPSTPSPSGWVGVVAAAAAMEPIITCIGITRTLTVTVYYPLHTPKCIHKYFSCTDVATATLM